VASELRTSAVPAQGFAAASNLKAVFRDLRNHLFGRLTGITRDEVLAQQIINVLFCTRAPRDARVLRGRDQQDHRPDFDSKRRDRRSQSKRYCNSATPTLRSLIAALPLGAEPVET
jgi:hypothetical protein